MHKNRCLNLCLAAFWFAANAHALPAENQAAAAAFFTDVRMGHAKSPGFEGSWTADPERDALLKLYDEEHPGEFIARSEPWLKKCPVDAKVHLMRSSLLIKIGDTSGHFYHRMVYYGLLTSIAVSGDGKTPKTAYKVISVDEEYTFLNHIGAKLVKQALVAGPCDAMTVAWNGKESVIYFDVSIPMSALEKAMDAGKKK